MTSKARAWSRILLAGPGAIVVALVTMAGMTRWIPAGSAGIDNLVLPLVLVPLLWAALFFYACLDPKLSRVAAVTLGLLMIHTALIAGAFMDTGSSAEEIAR
jgi:hypothetical protein